MADFTVDVPINLKGGKISGTGGGSGKGQEQTNKLLKKLDKSIIATFDPLEILTSAFRDVIQLIQPLIKMMSLLFLIIFLPLLPIMMLLVKGLGFLVKLLSGGFGGIGALIGKIILGVLLLVLGIILAPFVGGAIAVGIVIALIVGAIALFGSEPFSSKLRMSNIKNYKYDWIWEKEQGANFMLMKYQPYKVPEIISVFSNKTHLYNPQKTKGKPYISGKGDSGDTTGNVKKVQTKNKGSRFPRSIQKFTTDKSKSKHPTQKPVALMEYLIKTYTNEGEKVLDFTAGSFTTGVACVNLNREFVGIEKDVDYFNIGKDRIEKALQAKAL